ncbi:type IV secretory pathway protease TraF [Bradyrhizobium sp. GM24.11]
MTVTLPDCTFFIALDFLDLFVARRAFALPGYRVCRVQDSTMRRGVVLAVQLLNIDRMTFSITSVQLARLLSLSSLNDSGCRPVPLTDPFI